MLKTRTHNFSSFPSSPTKEYAKFLLGSACLGGVAMPTAQVVASIPAISVRQARANFETINEFSFPKSGNFSFLDSDSFSTQSVLSPKEDTRAAALRSKICSFREMQTNWNGYGAKPVADFTCETAEQLADEFLKFELYPDWVIPTADSTILIELKVGVTNLTWECFSDGDIALKIKKLFDPPRYLDVSLNDVAGILKNSLSQR